MLANNHFCLLKYQIINSIYFRSLQYKSQLLPMGNVFNKNYIVQNRLTHSLQVANIAKMLGSNILKNNQLNLEKDFLPALEIAGLVHDIGITPFGHTGERAIRDWWQEKSSTINIANHNAELFLDFTKFDGNAQGLRILVNFFNLDKLSLKSYLKYTHSSSSNHRKAGYFLSEEKQIFELLHLRNDQAIEKSFSSYIVETADDIANALGDLNDCLNIAIIDQLHFKTWIKENFTKDPILIKDYLEADFYKDLLKLLQTITLNIADKIQLDSPDYTFIKLIRKYISLFVYNNPIKQAADLVGYDMLRDLLQNFDILLNLSTDDFIKKARDLSCSNNIKPTTLEQQLLACIPINWLNVYLNALETHNIDNELYFRIHLIIDVVSSMSNEQITSTMLLLKKFFYT